MRRRHDFLLARVADDLVERLAAVSRSFPIALNLGALPRPARARGCAGCPASSW